ncbi:TRAP transporter small permease [Pseudochelatococcus sp. B33]
MTVIKVVLRSIFNYGILGVDQISGTMMVYLTFLGAAWVLRNEGHVSVDLLTSAVPARVERGLHVVASIVAAAVCFTMTYFSFVTVRLSLQRGVMVAAELEIPRAINLAVIPLGCALLGIEFIRRARRYYLGIAEQIPAELREH